jgi:hypothetical protein
MQDSAHSPIYRLTDVSGIGFSYNIIPLITGGIEHNIDKLINGCQKPVQSHENFKR